MSPRFLYEKPWTAGAVVGIAYGVAAGFAFASWKVGFFAGLAWSAGMGWVGKYDRKHQ